MWGGRRGAKRELEERRMVGSMVDVGAVRWCGLLRSKAQKNLVQYGLRNLSVPEFISQNANFRTFWFAYS